MLDVQSLNAWYGRAHILHDVAFTLRPGEVLLLLGRNGAGKSTTLKSLMGLVRPATGRIALDGRDLLGHEPHQAARAGLGYVPEDRRIFTGLSVLENLDVARAPPRPGLQPWTPDRLFALFPNLAAMPHRPGGRMSGGEQQMLAIARTLMGNPRYVLLDEPSEGLAPLVVAEMARAIAALKAEGVAILLAEPNLRFAASLADHALILESGRPTWSGPLPTLLADEALRRTHLGV